MLPTLGHTVPSGRQWALEIKHDRYRFIGERNERNREAMELRPSFLTNG
jgi:hypothetical protein